MKLPRSHLETKNCTVHVLDVCHTPDERLLEFPEEIACMFLAIKYAKDKKKLAELSETAKFHIEMKFCLSEEEAEGYMKKYWTE